MNDRQTFKSPKLSVEAYIEQEIDSGIKYEYHNGEIFALAGGTINHGILCSNIFSQLAIQLTTKRSSCRPYTSEIKLHIVAENSFVYPDAMVVCDELEVSPFEKNAIVNPILIVEVLSKSTANYDRGDKFFKYKQIPSLQEYVLIEQDKAIVDTYFKRPGVDLWRISRFEGLNSLVQLQSIGIQMLMSDLYAGVKDLADEKSAD